MRIATISLRLALLTVLLAAGASAQTYNLILKNDSRVDSSRYEFEIWIERTGGTELELSALQAVVTFNTGISGGSLDLSLNAGTSGLVLDQVPTSMSVTGNELRIQPESPPGAGSGTIIPTAPGVRVGRFRLTGTTAFAAQQADIAWKNSVDPSTRVSAYDNADMNVEITNSAGHQSQLSNPVLSIPVITSTSPRPGATAGTLYRDTLRATGGSLPLSWSLIAGALPAGMSLSSAGIITGTATTPGTANFTARVADASSAADTGAFSLTVTVGAPTQLAFVQQPTDEIAGATLTPAPSVRLTDNVGNTVATAGVSVTMSLTSGNGTLDGTVTEITNGSGIAVFDDLSIDRKGVKVITASSAITSSIASASFTILSSMPSQIRVETAADGTGLVVPPQSVGPLAPLTVYAISRDEFDNFIENIAANTWTLQAVTGGVTAGDLVAAGDSRSAVFTGHLVGSAQIRATSPSITAVNSGTITVIPGAARRLAFVQQPTGVVAGATISPAVTVQLRDTANNAVAAQGVDVTMTLSTGTGTLGGTTQQATGASGLATFGDLTVNVPGAKALSASAAGLTSAVSSGFTVTTYTITATAGPNGSISPSGAVPVNHGANQAFTIAANSNHHILNVVVDGGSLGAVSGHTFTNVTANHTISATFGVDSVQVTVQTSPAGRSIRVDGVLLTAPQVFNWISGSVHTIATDSLQNGAAGTRYLYEGWSDAGTISHTVTPSANTTYTATFGTQHFLTMNAGPGGTVNPISNWHDAGASVGISATPAAGFSFASWAGSGAGSVSGGTNPTSVTMNAPITETGSFSANPIAVTVTTNPAGRQIIVDGTTFTSPQIFNWTATETHSISVDSLQNGAAGTRYLYTAWSDAGARTHNVTPLTDGTFIAAFSTQHFLTVNAGTGGTAAPASDWRSEGAAVGITATPSLGYSFGTWTGTGSGSYSGNANPSGVTVNGPITETANFTPNAIVFTVTTSPAGRNVIVDDTVWVSPKTFTWNADQPHTISVDSLQNGAPGTRYVYASWSNGGTRTQTIAPLIGGTITANLTTQHFLTMQANAGGTATPASNWFNAAQSVQITGVPGNGFDFLSWAGTGTGSYSGTTNPQNVTVNGPITQTASFVQEPVNVTIQTSPAGRTFTVDGVPHTNSFSFSYAPEEVHTVAADSIQNGAAGTRYVWTSWSDGGARAHTIPYPGADTTFVVNFKTQHQLTMNAAAGGTSTPPTGFFDAAQVVQISATPNPNFAFAGWAGSGPGAYSGTNNPANVTMNGPVTETPSFSLAPIDVTIQTNPAGLSFTVDGTPFTSPQTFQWTATQAHTIATASPQGDSLTRFVYASWSDGGAQSHSVAPGTDTVFTVSFTTQHRLATAAGTGGTVTPPTGFFNAGQSVPITATPNTGYNFGGWTGSGSGSYTGTNNPGNVTMNSPITETGNFTPGSTQVTVTTIPVGRTITVDGLNFTSPQTFNWITGSTHTIGVDSLQLSGTPGVRYRWQQWSDGGDRSHTVAPVVPTTYTAGFRTQYQLTMNANPGGSVTPPTQFHDSLANVVITATPIAGYIFSSWTGTGGPGSGFYTGSTNPQTIVLGGPVTETANFVQPPVNVTIQTNPPGRTFRVDNGTLQTNTFTFSFGPGTTHTVSADSIQNGPGGTRYVWTSWSDGGERAHTLTYPGRDTTFVVNFKTQFQLTMNSATGGTTSPPSGFFDSAAVVPIGATPTAGFSFAGWTGTGTGSYSGPANPSAVTMGSPISETPSYTLAPIDVTVQTNPPGRTFIVDGVTYTNSQAFVWSATASHTLNTTSPQGDTATRFVFATWSDGGAQSHTVAPLSDTTFTVNFTTQHFLTMDTGTGNGSVLPASNWFNAGQSVQISATPDAGYVFGGWSGTGAISYTGPNNPASVTMNSPVREVPAWTAGTTAVTVTTIPPGLPIIVDGVPAVSPQSYNWVTGSSHSISVDTLAASGGTGLRYRWLSWSDAGARTHTVAPVTPTTYTALYRSQYLLTTVANPGGTVSPVSSWYDSNTVVGVTAIPNSGYGFTSWAGTGTISYSGNANPTNVTMRSPITETANFSQLPVQVTIVTNPPGRTFRVDGGALQTSIFTFTYNPGDAAHSIGADSIQAQNGSGRWVWSSWSDGGTRVHTIPFPGRDTTFVVNFKRQYFLTMNAGLGGTVQPPSGYFDSAASVPITATPTGGYTFSGWVGSGPGSFTGPDNPSAVTMDSTITETGTFTLAPIDVTIQTNPSGLAFTVDGTPYTGSQAFVWSATSPHTIAAVSPQGDTATRYLFASWSDGGAQSHSVTPSTDSTFTVNYSTQYYLTMDTGTGGGILTPPSGFFNAGQPVQISAAANSGYEFSSWTGTGTGSYTGANNPATVTMNSPIRETVSWAAGTIPVTVTTSPAGLVIWVDSVQYTSPQSFNWVTGSAHTIWTDSLQPSGVTGVRFRWSAWSDAGAMRHTVSPTSAATFTATFVNQYLLTMSANPGGTVTPPTGWYDAGSPVTITGIPNAGFSFSSWTGTGAGAYSGSANPRGITIAGPVTEIANFVQNPYQVVVQTIPDGRTFRVSGTNYTTTQTFSITPGTVMSLSIPQNPQDDPADPLHKRYAWANWSDSGSISHNFTPASDTVITATFATQYLLTMTAGTGGTVTPPTGWFDSGTLVPISATPSGGYTFAGWVGTGPGSYSGASNLASVTMNGPIAESASFTLFPITVRLRSTPAGRTVMVDSVAYTTPQDIIWTSGSTHTISADSIQNGTPGVRHLWTSWSDGKPRTHSVVGLTDTTFSVSFRPQYQLTMNAGTGGGASPASGWRDSGAVVPITATPNTGYVFSGWSGSGTGSYTGPDNPSSVTMGSPVSETANFALNLINVTVRTSPDGQQIRVDDTLRTSPATFQWTATSTHTVSVDSVFAPAGGARLAFTSWSDGGARTHTISPNTDSVFTAALGTQYFVTMNANPGGTVTPPSGWFNANQPVSIQAFPGSGYTFAGWSGSGSGAYSGTSNPRSVTIIGPITETANFTQNSILVTVQTDPPGRSFRVDGTTYNSLFTFAMLPGSSHAFTADSLQTGLNGRRYVWTGWSDGGARTHNFIAPAKDSTVVVSFGLQYELSTFANPPAGGTVVPLGQSFYNEGDTATVSAIASPGYAFTGWTGSVTSSSNPLAVVMDTAKFLLAQFEPAARVVIRSNPPGRTVIVDGSSVVAPDTFAWLLNSVHTLGSVTPQNGDVATRYLWTGWSDSGTMAHSVTVTRDTVFTANFQTQYYLFMSSGGNGTVQPSEGWYDQGDTVELTGVPSTGYGFVEWIGEGSGSYSGYSNPILLVLNGPATELGVFGQVLPPPTLAGIPNHAVDQALRPRLTWNRYAGATSYIVQVAVDSLFSQQSNIVDTSVTDTTILLPMLRNVEEYHWRVKARVGTDISSFSEVRSFTTIGATIAVNSPALNWGTGFSYDLSWTAQNLSGRVDVLLTIDDGATFVRIDSNLAGTSTRYRVAPTQTPSNFCFVRVVSADNGQFYGDSRTFAILPGALSLVVPVGATVIYPPEPTISTFYRLVSHPGVVDTNVKLAALVPGANPRDWRMFSDNGQSSNYLTEMRPTSNFETGRGFWLLKKNNWDISANMVMPPLDTINGIYRIKLRPGWNIIANPFDRSASWSSVVALNNLAPATPLYGYEGSYEMAAVMVPFRGYYFYNGSNLPDLKIAYPFGSPILSTAAHEMDWELRLEYAGEINTDPSNFIGISRKAAEGLDELESRKPPLFLDQGFLYFRRPAWDREYELFSTDYRPAVGEGQTWEFEVSREVGTTGVLRFEGAGNIPAEYDVVLVNSFNSTPVNLRTTPEYAFSSVATRMPFKIMVGPSSYVRARLAEELPQEFGLAQNFPNPFNSTTSISVTLPRDSRIRLDVYSVLGQRIATLADGEYTGGVHTFLWEGTDDRGLAVSSGVYLYRLTEGEGIVQTKKMVIAK